MNNIERASRIGSWRSVIERRLVDAILLPSAGVDRLSQLTRLCNLGHSLQQTNFDWRQQVPIFRILPVMYR